jgi:hypothetical protein
MIIIIIWGTHEMEWKMITKKVSIREITEYI